MARSVIFFFFNIFFWFNTKKVTDTICSHETIPEGILSCIRYHLLGNMIISFGIWEARLIKVLSDGHYRMAELKVYIKRYVNRDMTTKMSMRPAKTRIRLEIRPVWSVFAVRMKKPWDLCYPLSAQRRLIRLGRCPGWSESSLDGHSFCWFCHGVTCLCL